MTYINLFVLSTLIVIALIMVIISVFVIYCIVSDIRYNRDVKLFDIITFVINVVVIFAIISGIIKYIDLWL